MRKGGYESVEGHLAEAGKGNLQFGAGVSARALYGSQEEGFTHS